jgi:RimJ/RimL family protein N-acetyltransferase
VSLEIFDGKKYRFRDKDLWKLAEIETHPKVTEWNMYPQTNDLKKMHILFIKSLKALPKREDQIFLIARLDDDVVGFLGIQCRKEGTDCVGNLGLAVHPNHWGKGIGRELLQKGVEQARKHQLLRLEAETFATNKPMLRIAEKAGFRVKGKKNIKVAGKSQEKVLIEIVLS